jgi:glycosyltransferase involved in cell wall biosynthesis
MQLKEFANPLPLLLKPLKLRPDSQLFARKPAHRPAPVRLVSIIIPAHNEEHYLGKTLEALKRQNYGWFEIIVVANGCTDRTAEVARGNCQRLIVLSQKGLGVARNLGARMARGDLLLFLDADTLLEPMALRIIAMQFNHSHGAGTLKGCPDLEDFKYQFIYFLKNLTHRTRLHRGSSGVIVCWKKHFIETGGFDEGLEVRENSELIRRLRRFGSYVFIGGVRATTSMRRYARHGCGRMFWLWCKLWAQSWFGDLHRRSYEPVR